MRGKWECTRLFGLRTGRTYLSVTIAILPPVPHIYGSSFSSTVFWNSSRRPRTRRWRIPPICGISIILFPCHSRPFADLSPSLAQVLRYSNALVKKAGDNTNNKGESTQTRPSSSSSLFLPCVPASVLRSLKPRVVAAYRICGLGLQSRKTASRSSLRPTAPRLPDGCFCYWLFLRGQCRTHSREVLN